jgi:Ca2+/Na+ antiporter
MVKEIKTCKKELDALLSGGVSPDWGREAEKLLVLIKFFQHERLIHLIVTMTMSLLTIITACAMFAVGHEAVAAFALLFVLFLTLTAFYLAHYYKLENGVQELYGYYKKLCEKAKNL